MEFIIRGTLLESLEVLKATSKTSLDILFVGITILSKKECVLALLKWSSKLNNYIVVSPWIEMEMNLATRSWKIYWFICGDYIVEKYCTFLMFLFLLKRYIDQVIFIKNNFYSIIASICNES